MQIARKLEKIFFPCTKKVEEAINRQREACQELTKLITDKRHEPKTESNS